MLIKNLCKPFQCRALAAALAIGSGALAHAIEPGAEQQAPAAQPESGQPQQAAPVGQTPERESSDIYRETAFA